MTKPTKGAHKAKLAENGAALDWDWPGGSLALIDLHAHRPRCTGPGWRGRERCGNVADCHRKTLCSVHNAQRLSWNGKLRPVPPARFNEPHTVHRTTARCGCSVPSWTPCICCGKCLTHCPKTGRCAGPPMEPERWAR